MARVRGVTAERTAAGSRLSVSGSTSTSTGRAPTCSITFTEAVKVRGVVITSSPGPTPSVASAVWRPAVHELSASAAGVPRYVANSVSKRLVFGPVVIQFERRVSTTSRISSSPMRGGANVRNSLRRAGARVTDTGAPEGSGRGRVGDAPGAGRACVRGPQRRTRLRRLTGQDGRGRRRRDHESLGGRRGHVFGHQRADGVDQLFARAAREHPQEVLETALEGGPVGAVALDDAYFLSRRRDAALGAR